MISDESIPSLSQLYDLMSSIKHYPVTANEVVEMAKSRKADRRVVDFYRSFEPDVIFESADDLATQSEAIEMMHAVKQPVEILKSPQS